MTASGGAATPLRLSMLSRMNPETLDHVALWVADRDRIADFLTGGAGMHVVERTDAFTLVGSDARRGKLTLFAEEGPRERGPLKHVALRVSDLETALADLPEDADIERPRDGEAYFDVHEGLRLGLVEADTDGRIRPRPCRALVGGSRRDGRGVRPPGLQRR